MCGHRRNKDAKALSSPVLFLIGIEGQIPKEIQRWKTGFVIQGRALHTTLCLFQRRGVDSSNTKSSKQLKTLLCDSGCRVEPTVARDRTLEAHPLCIVTRTEYAYASA